MYSYTFTTRNIVHGILVSFHLVPVTQVCTSVFAEVEYTGSKQTGVHRIIASRTFLRARFLCELALPACAKSEPVSETEKKRARFLHGEVVEKASSLPKASTLLSEMSPGNVEF